MSSVEFMPLEDGVSQWARAQLIKVGRLLSARVRSYYAQSPPGISDEVSVPLHFTPPPCRFWLIEWYSQAKELFTCGENWWSPRYPLLQGVQLRLRLFRQSGKCEKPYQRIKLSRCPCTWNRVNETLFFAEGNKARGWFIVGKFDRETLSCRGLIP